MEPDDSEIINKSYHISLIKQIKNKEYNINKILSTQRLYHNRSHIINSLNTIIINISLFIDKEFILFERFKENKKNIIILNHDEVEHILIKLECYNIKYKIINSFEATDDYKENYNKYSIEYDVIILLNKKIPSTSIQNWNDFILFNNKKQSKYYNLIDLFYYVTHHIEWNTIIVYNISYKISYMKSPIDDNIFICYPSFMFRSKIKIFLMELKNYPSNKIYYNLIKNSFNELMNYLLFTSIYKYSFKCIDNPNINEKEFHELVAKNYKITTLFDSEIDERYNISDYLNIVKCNNLPILFNYLVPQYALNEYNNFNIMIDFLTDEKLNIDNNLDPTLLSILSVFNIDNKNDNYNIQDLITYIEAQKKLIEPIFNRLIENINNIECGICYEDIDKSKIIILDCCLKTICEQCVIKSTYKHNLNLCFPIETKLINGKCPYCNAFIQLEKSLIKYNTSCFYSTNTKNRYSIIKIIENIINDVHPKYDKIIKSQLKEGQEIKFLRKLSHKKNNNAIVISYNYKMLDFLKTHLSFNNSLIKMNEIIKMNTNTIMNKLKDNVLLLFVNNFKKTYYEKIKLISSHSKCANDFILLNFPSIDNIITINMILALNPISNIHIININ